MLTTWFALLTSADSHANTKIILKSDVSTSREVVVLLHGWWSSPQTLKVLQWRLQREGYEVVNLGYPSVRCPIEKLGHVEIPKRLSKRLSGPAAKIHFVTHSMGGLVLREFLEAHPIENLGRVVMIAPPNQGSPLADQWSQWKLSRWLAGPNLQRMRTDGNLASRAGEPVRFSLGIIAGDRSFFSAIFTNNHTHDGRVPLDATSIAGMQDRSVVHCSHSFLPWHPKVFKLTKEFLANGQFTAPVEDSVRHSSREDL